MADNPLKLLKASGQSVWLDYIRRDLITGGDLKRLIEEDGLCGMTTNPAIFEKAIAGTKLYDEAIARLAKEGRGAREIYEAVSRDDVRLAAGEFRPVYDASGGADGYVSLEVNPHLARDTGGTVAEARRLWKAVNLPNIMIKVPATREGLPAIKRLIGEGINVNVTLLFSLERYRETAEAYIAGLSEFARLGGRPGNVASVASFFLSRIDVMVDGRLDGVIAGNEEKGGLARELRGQAAVASAKAAYRAHKQIFESLNFKALAEKGAREQRLLWASTGTKDPDYSDVKYIEPLIGPGTVNTVPPKTLDAYRDHGSPGNSLEDGMEAALRVLDRLPEAGINMDEVTARLEEEGLEKFNKPFDKLVDAIEQKRALATGGGDAN